MTWAKKKSADQPRRVWLLTASSCSFHWGGPQPITEQDGSTGPSFVPVFSLELPQWVAVYHLPFHLMAAPAQSCHPLFLHIHCPPMKSLPQLCMPNSVSATGSGESNLHNLVPGVVQGGVHHERGAKQTVTWAAFISGHLAVITMDA